MVLITGASGFVGGRLLTYLHDLHIPIRILVRNYRVGAYPNDIQIYQGDILDINSVVEAMEGIEIIYHCAAMISYQPSDYDFMYKTNVEGTSNIVNAALYCGVKKIVHVSSIAALGARPGNHHINEEAIWDAGYKQTRYGISKMMAEHEIHRGMAEGLEACIVNPGVILGKNAPEDKSPRRILSMLKKGLAFYPTGSNGFVDVEDVVKSIYLLGKQHHNGERYIVVAENLTLYDYLRINAELLGAKVPRFAIKRWMIYLAIFLDKILAFFTNRKRLLSYENMYLAQQHFYYDNSKIKQAIGIEFRTVRESLQEVI